MFKQVPVWLFTLLCAAGCSSTKTVEPAATSAQSAVQSPSTAPAEPALPSTFSYPMLIERALTASPDYAATLASARAEYYRYKARTDWRDPEITGRYSDRSSDTFQHERNVLGDTSSQFGDGSRSEYGPSFNVSISNPFENRYILRAGRAAQREKEADAAILQNEVSRVIYEFFVQAVYETKAIALLRERETLLLSWKKHLNEQRLANVATQSDLLTLELKLMRLQATLAQKMITVQSALRSLSVLANLPSDHPIALEASFPNWRTTAERLAANTRLFDVACANSPDLVNAHAAYEKARAEGNAARARQIPWFTSAQAGYSWLNNDTTSQRADGRQTTGGTDSDEWEVRLSMTVPVFAWMSSEIKEADANMLAAQLKETAVRQRIQHELTGYVADLKSVTEQKTTYQLQFEKLAPPTEGSAPDMETFYTLSDAYRAAEEEFFMLDMQCAILYGQIMRTLSNWTLTTEHAR